MSTIVKGISTGTTVKRQRSKPAAAPKKDVKRSRSKAAAAAMQDVSQFENTYRVPARGNLNGGKRFELTRAGQRIKNITVWGVLDRLQGVRVTFEDDTVKQAGTLSGDEYSFALQKDDLIVATMISSSPYKAGRAGNIGFITDFGQKFLGGWPAINFPMVGNNFTQYSDLTKGLLIGIYGGAGADIDHLGVILALPQDVEYTFQDVKYEIGRVATRGERILTLKEQIVKNDSTKVTTNPSVTFSRTDSVTRNWSNTAGIKVGVKTTFKTGIPFIAEGKIELAVEGSYTYSWGGSATEQVNNSWTVPITVPPRTRARVVATITESTIDVPYSATLYIRKSDGTNEVKQNISGIYTGVNMHTLVATVEDLPM